MKMLLPAALALCGLPAFAYAAPGQSVECHHLKGATVEYGVPAKVRFKHMMSQSQAGPSPSPKLQYVPPYADGFPNDINFLIHPANRTVTVMWELSPVLQAANRRAAPGQPWDEVPAPVVARMTSYRRGEVIAATDTGYGVSGVTITSYTLLPKLRSVFITRTTYVSGGEPDGMVTTVRGVCDFSPGG